VRARPAPEATGRARPAPEATGRARPAPEATGRAFLRFWYDFVVGDDWTIAAGVAVALVVTAVVAHHGLPSVWWLLPLVVALGLTWSVWRAARPPRR
jgi:hypothetical protein